MRRSPLIIMEKPKKGRKSARWKCRVRLIIFRNLVFSKPLLFLVLSFSQHLEYTWHRQQSLDKTRQMRKLTDPGLKKPRISTYPTVADGLLDGYPSGREQRLALLPGIRSLRAITTRLILGIIFIGKKEDKSKEYKRGGNTLL